MARLKKEMTLKWAPGYEYMVAQLGVGKFKEFELKEILPCRCKITKDKKHVPGNCKTIWKHDQVVVLTLKKGPKRSFSGKMFVPVS